MTKQYVDDNGRALPIFRAGITQTVAYTGTHGAISNAVQAGTRLVRVWCTTDAFIKTAGTPVATSSHMPVTAKVAEYIPVQKNDKVSAIQVSAGGNLHVTELL